MNSPYWMAVVNFVIAAIVLFGILFYKNIYPKKNINYVILLVILSVLPCISIFRQGVFESGDFTQHLDRAIVFFDALKEGNLIPSWGGILNTGYGYPVFIFIYLFPYYLFALLHTIGFTFIFSGKLILALAYILSGFVMYFTLKKLVNNDLASFAGAIVYLFTPYHLVDLHFRVALPEVLIFLIAPLVFYLILKLEQRIKLIYFAWLSLLFGIFFLTHPAQFIFYSGLFFAYIVYQYIFLKKKYLTLLFAVAGAFLIGLIISSFSWIPRFTLSQYTWSSKLMHVPVSFTQPWELLYSPWKFGFLFQGHYGELSFIIGYTQIIVIVVALYFLLTNKFKKQISRYLLFWTTMTLIMIFLILPYSQFLWDTIPLLNLMQFSYRLLHPITFCLSIITAYLVLHFYKRKTIIYLFLIITVGYTILNWGNRGMLPNVTDNSLRHDLINATLEGEGMIEAKPIWWNNNNEFWITQKPKKPIVVLNGNAEIKQVKRISTNHTYIVYASTATTVLENTFYFPGWSISVDNTQIPINYQTKQYAARMVFNVPEGLHYIVVQYNDIPVLWYSKLASIIALLCILLYFIIYYTYSLNKILKNKRLHE